MWYVLCVWGATISIGKHIDWVVFKDVEMGQRYVRLALHFIFVLRKTTAMPVFHYNKINIMVD